MKRFVSVLYCLIILFLVDGQCVSIAWGQYNNHWIFSGERGGGISTDFSNGSTMDLSESVPRILNTSPVRRRQGRQRVRRLAVSHHQNGELLFFVDMPPFIPGFAVEYNKYYFFDKNGNLFPNGDIDYQISDYHKDGHPIAVPHPQGKDQYYVFYCIDGGLRYSVVDMRLNNGLGDVDTKEHNVMLTTLKTVIGLNMTTVVGCDGLWLVLADVNNRGFYSFKIDSNGLRANPVYSPVGNYTLDYYDDYTNRLASSNKGALLAMSSSNGVQLFDFNGSCGVVSNARWISDTASSGVCFSPDDTKLYYTENVIVERPPLLEHYAYNGKVCQVDVSKPKDISSIRRSRTVILRSKIVEWFSFRLGFFYDVSMPFGDLSLGEDGRIYLLGITESEMDANSIPIRNIYPPNTPLDMYSQYFHVIHQPNSAGMACNPERDYLKISTTPRDNNFPFDLLLPSPIRTVPKNAFIESIATSRQVDVCFASLDTLIAEEGICYQWDNGESEQSRAITESGTYWVEYQKPNYCELFVDTFHVRFIPMPYVPFLNYGCEGEGKITLTMPGADSFGFLLELRNREGKLMEAVQDGANYVFQKDITQGDYTLNIRTQNCDTTVRLTVSIYPKPNIYAEKSLVMVLYDDTVLLGVNGDAIAYTWYPNYRIDDVNSQHPKVSPLKNMNYYAVGTNAYGCRDTVVVQVNIDYNLPYLIPNAFSPNGDGLNDEFKMSAGPHVQLASLRVFNRYGNEVFYCTHLDKGWDGTFNGNLCDMGTYFYVVEIMLPDKSVKTEKGNITLLR